MDASFAQVCLVVSATAILMGRRETLTVARYIGVGFGRFVGTLQGYRYVLFICTIYTSVLPDINIVFLTI